MPILHDVPQYSADYDRLKLGLPTSSNFNKIITPIGGKPSGQWQDYAYHLLAERLLGRRIDSYTSPHMERGMIVESEAVDWYQWDHDVETQLIGFITNEERADWCDVHGEPRYPKATGTWGCSPDRLVGDDGLLELKCPSAKVQAKYLITGKADREHWPQLQGQLYISERKWVDIVSWHPELPRVVIRVERDQPYIDCLAGMLAEIDHYLAKVMDKINSLQRAAA